MIPSVRLDISVPCLCWYTFYFDRSVRSTDTSMASCVGTCIPVDLFYIISKSVLHEVLKYLGIGIGIY